MYVGNGVMRRGLSNAANSSSRTVGVMMMMSLRMRRSEWPDGRLCSTSFSSDSSKYYREGETLSN